MRKLFTLTVLVGLGVATSATAERLVMPNSGPEPYSAYVSQAIEQPWTQQRPEMQLREQPVGELLAARLGLAQGSAELFRYRLENGPSTRAQLDGMVDGGGIRLKLSW